MTVKVAIDLALDRLFDYEVPEALEKKLAVGQLLSVPFGHREVRGFVMAVEGEVDESRTAVRPRPRSFQVGLFDTAGETHRGTEFRLKPITAIVDETPFFSPALLELVKRVAAYTCSPLETVLKTALPAAVLKKNAKPQELLFIEPTLGAVPVSLTKRQEWLYAQIARLGGGWMSQLCHELKTTPATIKQLGQLGLVKVAVKAKRRNPLGNRKILPTKPLPLNEEQAKALEAIASRGDSSPASRKLEVASRDDDRRATTDVREDQPKSRRPVLLFGITGSGKTEVYLQAIAAELDAGRGAIVMVPEISLTPQTVQRFASRFGDRVAVLHSALSDGERYDEWHRIRSGAARVVVGPRSAVWAPVKDLGLIVVDEEHENSYKQDETPRYHARDIAVLRGAIEGARVVLGSATPSLESWMNVKKGKYALATMTKRAGAGTLPVVRLVDMGSERRDKSVAPPMRAGDGDATLLSRQSGGSIFSKDLLDAISLRLQRGEQTILFLNRRGYSRQVVCEDCGHVLECPHCSTPDRGMPYTYHRADTCLRCHICGGWIEMPRGCPQCKSTHLTYRGIGTQRAEAALKTCFKEARVLRMDADSTSRKNSHDEILGIFRRGEADILIGTQMIAKGLDFPNVTLVGVLNADSSINMPDFRASERTFQLLAQVSGRAGRAELPGEVIIQTYDPENAVLRFAACADYEGFAAAELKAREEMAFPPYTHLALVTLKSQDLREVSSWAEMYATSLQNVAKTVPRAASAAAGPGPTLEVSDALPSALEKADGWFRWQIVIRGTSNAKIAQAWRWLVRQRPAPKSLRVSIDIDALNLV